MNVVCWFDERGLHGNKRAKIKAYNRNKLIIPLGLGLYELKALKGNSQNHTVFYDGKRNSCTCQNFQIKHDKQCSHILSVEYYKIIEKGVIQ